MEQEKSNQSKEQIINLVNRKSISISGVNKVVSLKPELIQLSTNMGGLAISGSNLELVKLDNNLLKADIVGSIDCLKYVSEKDKQPFFRKLFK